MRVMLSLLYLTPVCLLENIM
uniref:Uncharacterized protein LOC105141207 isoform X3 n=1 Tax=Rhizophora mucronata TaxID=61149 RepID=A0A2P2JAD7_RHIMU